MPHTDTATATVDAPPDAAFAALIDAEARAKWLPPEGASAAFEHFDASPGGSYRLVLTFVADSAPGKSSEHTDVADGRFTAIEPPSRVVEAIDFVSDDPAFAGTMTMTWLVEPASTGSRVTVTAEQVPDGIDHDVHESALAETLANLGAYLG